ncbi:hypothetical protein AMECASPLE_018157 [Ameca splendens]|uniref:Uncharacterized protein n=1 Tax=Ameca splendens TaxID=208324 RepID=A0ABV0ZYD5_9TELE
MRAKKGRSVGECVLQAEGDAVLCTKLKHVGNSVAKQQSVQDSGGNTLMFKALHNLASEYIRWLLSLVDLSDLLSRTSYAAWKMRGMCF